MNLSEQKSHNMSETLPLYPQYLFIMKKIHLLILCLLTCHCTLQAQEDRIYQDARANNLIKGASLIRYTDLSELPNYVKFRPDAYPNLQDICAWMQKNLRLSQKYGLSELNRTIDELGMEHIRYRQTYMGIPIQGSMVIVHTRNGKVESFGGAAFGGVTLTSVTPSLSESTALQTALQKINATTYKWQISAEEQELKTSMQNPAATYYPKAELFILQQNQQWHVCYAFNIYAHEPMGRTMEYIDAQSGQAIFSKNLIEHVNVNGTAVTRFSGTQPFQTDSVSSTSYRLRDASRGLGVKTYNLANGTNYGTAADFTDADNYWNNVNAAHDEAATDAHWGSQKTYEYFLNKHNRNSIDDAGYALNSYVHYSTNYVNAFWDGTRMTYGDGQVSQGFLIMTGLDVCGHEITHGLTNLTSDLSATSSGTAECDALNEAYSDIFGTAVEKYARPTQWDWVIGGDITCNSAGVQDGIGIRNMSNPTLLGQPKCYLGTNWNTTGEPHDNDGPLIYWYYLLSTGSTTPSITALGTDTAGKIAFRTLTIHLFPNATYADARFYSILSSSELYGGCSVPTIATTNAWAAVCVGTIYVAAPADAQFAGDVVQTCDTSLTVNFANNSTNCNSFIWDFGDGTTSTQYTPSHTYSSGVYTVKLVGYGGSCGNDSLIQTAYVQVGPPPGPVTTGANLCSPGSATVTAVLNNPGDSIRWYTAAIGGTLLANGLSYTTPVLSTTTTYYAEEQVVSPSIHVGPLNNTIGTGGNYTNTTRFMIFDCSSPCTLVSVWVLASSAGNRTIILKDAAGATLQSVIVNIPNGASVVTLNMPIPVGTGLQLGLATGSTVNLYRNNAGAVYPYTNGPISITGNNAAGSAAYYYFFYDWVVKGSDCYSVRTPAVVNVSSGTGATPASITPGTSGLTACAPATVTLNANTGSGYTYQWYNGTTLINGATSSTYTASTSGNYQVVVSSPGGCLTPGTSSPVAVAINTTPSANITPAGPTTFCTGNSVVLNANTGAGLTYQWYNGTTLLSGATNSNYTATASGNYKVVVSNGSCSAAATPTTVTVNNIPTANATPAGTTTFCAGSSVMLMANSGTGYTYQWYNGTTAISGATNISYTASNAGNYQVVVSAGASCSATSTSIPVTVNALPTATNTASGPTSFCAGGSVLLNANTGSGLNYQWYNGAAITGATNASYTATQTGNYNVVITNANNCSASAVVIPVTVNQNPVATITPSSSVSFCAGSNTVLNANTGIGFTYQWYNGSSIISGATNASYTVSTAGSYSVTISNASSCSDTSSSVSVTVIPLPTPTIINTSGQLSVSGGPYTTYQWYLGGTAIAGATNATYTPTANGDYIVKVSLDGCDGTSAIIKVTGVGVTDIAASMGIIISPNPVSSILHIEGIHPYHVIVRNMQGAIVKEAYQTQEISLAHLAQGIYMLQITDKQNQNLLNQKIIKE